MLSGEGGAAQEDSKISMVLPSSTTKHSPIFVGLEAEVGVESVFIREEQD